MSKITYDDKVALNINSNIADINKVNASDMNEIKQVVNDNDDSLNNLQTYSTNEIVIGKWKDNKSIYRRVLTGTTPSSATGSVNFNNNIDTLVNESIYVLSGSNYYVGRGYYENNAIQFSYTINKSTSVYFSILSSNMQNRPFTLIIEYTKTTD